MEVPHQRRSPYRAFSGPYGRCQHSVHEGVGVREVPPKEITQLPACVSRAPPLRGAPEPTSSYPGPTPCRVTCPSSLSLPSLSPSHLSEDSPQTFPVRPPLKLGGLAANHARGPSRKQANAGGTRVPRPPRAPRDPARSRSVNRAQEAHGPRSPARPPARRATHPARARRVPRRPPPPRPLAERPGPRRRGEPGRARGRRDDRGRPDASRGTATPR